MAVGAPALLSQALEQGKQEWPLQGKSSAARQDAKPPQPYSPVRGALDTGAVDMPGASSPDLATPSAPPHPVRCHACFLQRCHAPAVRPAASVHSEPGSLTALHMRHAQRLPEYNPPCTDAPTGDSALCPVFVIFPCRPMPGKRAL